MKNFKFKARYFNYNSLHDQHEYMVSFTGVDATFKRINKTPFIVAFSSDFSVVNKVSEPFNPYPDFDFIVASVTDDTGCKTFISAFKTALLAGVAEEDKAAFNFTLSYNNKSEFKFVEIKKACTGYYKNVNGSNYRKLFSTDLDAALAVAKLDWWNSQSEDTKSELPTQLNVDVIYDEEDKKELYLIELDYEGQWYDATTWESGPDVQNKYYSRTDIDVYLDDLNTSIRMNFEDEWKSFYALDGEFYNYVEYSEYLENHEAGESFSNYKHRINED